MNEHIGSIIGNYELDKSIGGASVVWRAHQLKTNDLVVIKRNNPERFLDINSPTEMANNSIEYELALLKYGAHKGVCEALDLVKRSKYSWLVLKDYGNTSIADIDNIDDVGPTLMNIAEGISHLHDLSIIHGDITPAHMIDGRLIDFDSAFQHKIWEYFYMSTPKGATPGYIPPKYDESNPQSRYDVFGFCRSAFEAFQRIGSISDYSEIEKVIRAGMSEDIDNLPTMNEIKTVFERTFS